MGLFGRMKDAFSNVTEDVEPKYELEEQDSSAVLPDESGVVSSGSAQVVDGEFVDNAIEEASATEGPLIFPEIIPPSESDVEKDGADEGLDVALELSEMNDGLILEPVGETLEGGDDGQEGSFVSGELDEFSVPGEEGAGSLLGEGSFDGLDVGEVVSDSGAEEDGEQDASEIASTPFDSSDADVEPVEGSSLFFEGAEGDEESEAGESVSAGEGGSSLLWSGERCASEAEDGDFFVALEPSLIDLDSHYLGDYRSESLRPAAVVDAGSSVAGPVVASDVFETSEDTSGGQDVKGSDSVVVEGSGSADSLSTVEDGAGENGSPVTAVEESLGEDSSGSSIVSQKWVFKRS